MIFLESRNLQLDAKTTKLKQCLPMKTRIKSVQIYYANIQACAKVIKISCLQKYEQSTSRPFPTSNLVLFMSFAACFLLENICTSQITNGVKQRAVALKSENNTLPKLGSLLHINNSMREKALPNSITFQREKRNH